MEMAFDWLRELRVIDFGHGARDQPVGALQRTASFGAKTLRAETLGAAYFLSQTNQSARLSRRLVERAQCAGVLSAHLRIAQALFLSAQAIRPASECRL